MVAVIDISRRFWPLSYFDGWRQVPAYGKRRRAIVRATKQYAESVGEEVTVFSNRAPVKGRWYYYGGHALGWLGLALTVYGLLGAAKAEILHVLLGPFGVGVVAQLLAGPLTRHGRRLLQPTAAEVLEADKRRPVLLLRSFRDDDAEIISKVDENGAVETGRLEEAFAPPFSPYGPLVAIGRPGEALPQVGASRSYFGDADWKSVIDRWMDQALLLLVVPGTTRGLGWELERIAQRRHGHKLLLLMPPPNGFLPWQGKVGLGWSLTTSGKFDMASQYQWQPKSNSRWAWDSTSGKLRTKRAMADEKETMRQQRWLNVRDAWSTVPGLAALPEKAPDGLIAMHLDSTGEPVLIVGPEVPRSADYISAIAFAVYGMKVHGKW